MKLSYVVVLITSIFILIPSVFCGIHTETFTDFSGFDPSLSTAKWNIHQNRLEIFQIQDSLVLRIVDLCSDNVGGYYILYYNQTDDGPALYLQHVDQNGFPVFEDYGVLVTDLSGPTDADLAISANGNVYVTWLDSEIYAQRFYFNGNPAWPSPVQVNDSSASGSCYSPQIAFLPGYEVVIGFTDNRSGEEKVYLQKLDNSGTRQWAGDVRVQTGGTYRESDVRLSTTSTGTIYVCWVQEDMGIADIGFSRVDINGNVLWDPARIANLETAENEYSPSMCILNNADIYISWIHTDGTRYYVDIQQWNSDGTCDHAADTQLASHSSDIPEIRLNALASGNILFTFSEYQEPNISLKGRVIGPDMSPLTEENIIAGPTTDMIYHFEVETGLTGEAMCVWTAHENIISSGYFMQIDNLGQSAWPTCRKIETRRAKPINWIPGFTKNSGHQHGFKYNWISNRAHGFHSFGNTFLHPTQTDSAPQKIGAESNILESRSAQAPDGTIALVWVTLNSADHDLMIMWCDSDWNPLWTEPLIVKSFDYGYYPTSLDIDIDSQGRAVVCWSDNYDAAPGVFLNVVSPDRQLVHGLPVKVDDGIFSRRFYNVCILPDTTGGTMVVWSDDTLGDYNIWAQKITATGTHEWSAALRISPSGSSFIYQADLVSFNNVYCVVFTAYDGSGCVVQKAIVSDTGTLLDPPQAISDYYDYFSGLCASVMNNDVYVIWTARESSQQYIFAQKLVCNSPIWTDKYMTGPDYEYINDLDIITNATNTLAFTFNTYTGASTGTYIQEIDSDGNSTIGSIRPFLLPEPRVYDYEYGVSSMLNSGEQVHWAMINGEENPQNGSVEYWFTNDGGISWYQVEEGLPIVFPTSGFDLRSSADLYAGPYQTVSPEVTSITTCWNESQVASDLVINQEHFYTGDLFRLSVRHSNSGEPVQVEKYVLLDVYDAFWFWPSWSETLDFRQVTIPSGYTEEIILEFTWPADTGMATGLRFWTALLEPGTSNLVGPWDYVTFGYGP